MQPTFTLAMPISGAKFANQVGICLHLLKCKYQPDVILGTSGGCITGALLVACGVRNIKDSKSFQAFRRRLSIILGDLDASHYCKKRCNNDCINTLMAIGCFSIFERGTGADFESFKKQSSKSKSVETTQEIFSTMDLSNQPELWMGTTCKKGMESCLFCTKARGETIIRLSDGIYLNSKVEDILQVVVASSAVPSLVPPVKFRNEDYCDGGMCFASPLGPCMPAFDAKQLSYHVVYINPTPYNPKEDPKTNEIEDDDTWNKISSSMMGMVRGLCNPDRNNGIRAVGPNARKRIGAGEVFLLKCLARQRRARRSFIELAPIIGVHTNFLTICKGDVLRDVNQAYDNDFTVRHWFVM